MKQPQQLTYYNLKFHSCLNNTLFSCCIMLWL